MQSANNTNSKNTEHLNSGIYRYNNLEVLNLYKQVKFQLSQYDVLGKVGQAINSIVADETGYNSYDTTTYQMCTDKSMLDKYFVYEYSAQSMIENNKAIEINKKASNYDLGLLQTYDTMQVELYGILNVENSKQEVYEQYLIFKTAYGYKFYIRRYENLDT